MSFFSNSSDAGGSVDALPIGLDLNAVMRQVYLWMGLGLLVAFGIAFILGNAANNAINTYQVTGNLGAAGILLNPIVAIVALIAYFILGFALQPIINRSSVAVGSALYLVFCALFGFMIADIFIAYSGATIALAFVAT